MEELGHAVWIMTRGYNQEILIWHREAFNDIRGQVNRHSKMNAKALAFRRLLFASACEGKLDQQGRLAVPQNLRDFASLNKESGGLEAVVIGVDDHLELWNMEAWRSFQEGQDDGFEDMAAPFFIMDESGVSATERVEG
jgi:MraZ protein